MSDESVYERAREEIRYLNSASDGSTEAIEDALDAGEKAEKRAKKAEAERDEARARVFSELERAYLIEKERRIVAEKLCGEKDH
jgi:hypothetical protein